MQELSCQIARSTATILAMRQANLGLDLTTKRTRKREFLDEMNRVVPWGELVALVAPHAPEGKRGQTAVSSGDDVANPLYAAVVHLERSRNGRSVA